MINLLMDNFKLEPSPRPRLSKGNVFMPKKYTDNKLAIQYEVKKHMRDNQIKKALTGEAVKVFVLVYYELPKSYPKYKKEKLLNKPKTSKPDCDNLIKTVLDACNDIAYEDDRQVVSVCLEKYWSNQNSMQIKITTLR